MFGFGGAKFVLKAERPESQDLRFVQAVGTHAFAILEEIVNTLCVTKGIYWYLFWLRPRRVLAVLHQNEVQSWVQVSVYQGSF